MNTLSKLSSVFLFSTAVALTGCGGGGDNPAATGTANLGVTDAPVDGATHVVVQFTGVEVKPSGGPAITTTFAVPKTIDLLALQGGGSTLLLQGVTLPAGSYEYVRLMVNAGRTASDSYIDLDDGSRHALFIPSGNQTGLKLNNGFSVPANGLANFTIDFNLRASIHDPQGMDGVYIMRPTLRIVENSQTGAIGGTVTTATASAAGCAPAVYVYAGNNAATGDEGSNSSPLTTATVALNTTSGNYEYTAAFLPLGPYTVAFTCNADLDSPDSTDGSVIFQAPTNATVTAGQTSTVNF